MKAIDIIRKAMGISDYATFALIQDMRNAPMTQPTPKGGNHPLWVLGHLTFLEGQIRQIILGEPHPLSHWRTLFEPGSQPKIDASAYPTFDEILSKYRELRARNLELLEQIGDDALEQAPKAVPQGLEEVLRTAADVFLVIGSLHQMHHRGQVADARRAIGREPLFTPGAIKSVV